MGYQKITGGEALVKTLQAQGIKYVFGNPGTTEIPLLDALEGVHDIEYVTALFEGVAVGMADAYARYTRKPSFVNLHISVGVANGLSLIYNASRGGTPMVVTAGQADTKIHLHNPTLYSNMVNVMREYTKWAGEVTHPGDIPAIMRRAFNIASTPPTGPVFVSLPWNTLVGEDYMDIKAPLEISRVRPDSDLVAKAALLLKDSKNPLILIGDRVAQSIGAPEAIGKLSLLLGAPVYALSYAEVNIASSHPNYMGSVYTSWLSPRYKTLIDGADVALAVGVDLVTQMMPTPPVFSENTALIHLDCAASEIGNSYTPKVGICSDIKIGIEDIYEVLQNILDNQNKEAIRERSLNIKMQKALKGKQLNEQIIASRSNIPMTPEVMMNALAQVLPPNAVICNDAISNSGALLSSIVTNNPGDLFGTRGGSLGWGMPGALGLKLACPERPVIAVVGDGSAMYTIQALWTSIVFDIPVIYIICNNKSYRVLKQAVERFLANSEKKSEYIGLDFDKKPLDFVKMAQAFDLEGCKVESPSELTAAIKSALASNRTQIIDVVVDGSIDVQSLRDDWRSWSEHSYS